MILWVPLLFGCLSEPPYGAAVGTVDSGSPSDETGLQVEPEWTPEQAVAALQVALDAGLPQPWLARDAFLGLIEEGQDEVCPGTTDFDGSKPLGCTSESGYLYAGISEYRENSAGWSLGGDFEIQDPRGNAFHGAGYLFIHGDGHGQLFEFSGSWSQEGGEGWLDPGRSGMFQATVGGDQLELNGGFDLDGAYLHYADVVFQSEPEQALQGTVGIRDAAGAWWWLELEDDGCGELVFGIEDRGRGCIDLEEPLETWVAGLSQ